MDFTVSALACDLLVFKSTSDTKRLGSGGATPSALMDTSMFGFDHCTGKVREDSNPDLASQ